ncbi:PAS domain S-box protein [Microvirga sp. G4-2]|uniref:PAS domain S-box protein n=1 Tax=Microvirga sp. G4-2 TaxID=3434467 RepID=UPI004043B218
MTAADDLNSSVAGVDDVPIPAELVRRPSRPPDYAAENRALTTLAQEMASTPRTVLQTCAALAMELCHADSAIISLREPGDERRMFRWHAIAGGLTGQLRGGIPLEASPCGTVCECNNVLLFNAAERLFSDLGRVEPRVYENLLALWHSDGQLVGTLWAVKHTPEGRFDAEDARLLQSLARFAAAHRMAAALDEARTGRDELEQRVEERTRPLSEAYESVRASETRFRTALEIETVGVIYLDLAGRIIDANDAFLAMGGYSRDDLEAGRLTWQGLTPPEWMEASERAIAELKATGRTTPYEKEYIRKDGSRWWALFAAKRLPDGTIFEFVLDLTARRETEERLQESEERFRSLVENWAQAVWETDAEGRVTTDSPSWRAYTGQSLEEWLGTGWANAIHPDDRARLEQQWSEAVRERRPLDAEAQLRRAGGGWRWTNVHAAPLLAPDGTVRKWVGMNIDITERKEAEDALRASEARFQHVARATRDIIWDIDLVADRVWWSDAMLRQLGYAPGAIGPDTAWCFAHMHPDDRERVVRGMREAAAGIGDTWLDEFRYQRADGSYATIADRGFILRDTQGKAVRMIGAMQDISVRRQAEEALRASEERFRQFGEASTDVLWIRNADTLQWEYLSPAFEAVYGESREKALAGDTLRSWSEQIIPEDRAHVLDSIKRVRAGERVTFEFRIRRPDGPMRWLRDTDFPLLDETGRVQRIGGIGQDITERKEAEEALRASESRARLLLGELQHRVRNTLSVIRSIVKRTAQTSTSVEDYAMHLDGRINAFARVQTAVARDPTAGLDLTDLVADELLTYAAHQGEQVRITGPSVRLKPKAAETFGLAIHELATNAVKHGALNVPHGRIRISWRVQNSSDPPWLVFEWKESGTPDRAAKRKRRGFGTDLLERTLTYELKAKTVQTFEPDGLRCTIELPMTERLVMGSAANRLQPD